MKTQVAWTRSRRWLAFAALAVAAAGLLYWAYRPRPLVVEVASVDMGAFEQVIEEDGRLRLKERYVISAPTAAQLQRPKLKVGDTVRAGDVVASLRPVSPQMIDARAREVLRQRVGSADAARRAAAAQVQRQQTALAQAGLEADRALQLARDNFIAPSARDQAQLARQAAQQALEVAQAQQRAVDFQWNEARAALGAAEPASGSATAGVWQLRSPVDGQVLRLHLDSDAPVSAGQPLLDVGNTSALEAVIDVLSSEAQRIAPGARVQLSFGSGSARRPGLVRRIEPVAFTKVSALGIEEQRVNVLVDLAPVDAAAAPAAAATPALGDGFRVDARITVSLQASVLRVPSAALVRDGSGWRVWVLEAGHARARALTLHDRNADWAWVKDGLRQGEQVLLYPGTTITEAQPVKPR